MVEGFNPVRYSIIEEKNPREIVMLVGNGCKWRRCTFCDYHLDSSPDNEANYNVNKVELEKITGLYHNLEVINSGSFVDLDENTMKKIESVCIDRKITQIHFECHWMHRDAVTQLRARFENIGVKVYAKLGLETFDYKLREEYLIKGIDEKNPEKIAEYFDEINLLQGIKGQNEKTMLKDIETGLKYFDRVCVNIMKENTTSVKPDDKVIGQFIKYVYPKYKDNIRVDILLDNTDFGVGENKND